MRSIENYGQAANTRKLTQPCFSPPLRISWTTGDNWRSKGFGGGFPEGLQAYAEELRDMVDYDVVDERLVSEGFLKSYRYLIWPTGKIAEAETLEKVKTWVDERGNSLVAGLENIKTVEQNHGAFEDLAKLPATNGVRQVGKGKIIKIGDKVKDLDAAFPAALDARDGVLISAFKEGTLVFNKTDKTVEKTVSVKSASHGNYPRAVAVSLDQTAVQSISRLTADGTEDRSGCLLARVDKSQPWVRREADCPGKIQRGGVT